MQLARAGGCNRVVDVAYGPEVTAIYSVDEVLAVAEQVERDGQTFYELAARRCADRQGKQALEHLARWEGTHGPMFAEIRRKARDANPDTAPYDPNGEAERYLQMVSDQHVFRAVGGPEALLAGTEGPRQIFELALRFERDSIALFQGLAAVVPEGAEGLAELVNEEHEHVAHLQRLLKYGKW